MINEQQQQYYDDSVFDSSSAIRRPSVGDNNNSQSNAASASAQQYQQYQLQYQQNKELNQQFQQMQQLQQLEQQDRPKKLSVSSVSGVGGGSAATGDYQESAAMSAGSSTMNRYNKKSILKPTPIMSSSPRPDVPPKPATAHFFKKSDNRMPFSSVSSQQEYVLDPRGGVVVSGGGEIPRGGPPVVEEEYFDQFKKVHDYKYVQHVGHEEGDLQPADYEDDDDVYHHHHDHSYQQQNPTTPTFAPHTTALERGVRPSIAVRSPVLARCLSFFLFVCYYFVVAVAVVALNFD